MPWSFESGVGRSVGGCRGHGVPGGKDGRPLSRSTPAEGHGYRGERQRCKMEDLVPHGERAPLHPGHWLWEPRSHPVCGVEAWGLRVDPGVGGRGDGVRPEIRGFRTQVCPLGPSGIPAVSESASGLETGTFLRQINVYCVYHFMHVSCLDTDTFTSPCDSSSCSCSGCEDANDNRSRDGGVPCRKRRQREDRGVPAHTDVLRFCFTSRRVLTR